MSGPTTLEVKWTGDLELDAVTQQGVEVHLDSNGRTGVSPMEALLAALCGCMAIDGDSDCEPDSDTEPEPQRPGSRWQILPLRRNASCCC
ncbi:MAG: OsmC family protein [Acidobacteriota bacterium]